eukprot:m.36668 g.36668  ORF g.36668 m.36668 type:complete len:907 (-) comp6691_c0_seq1:290-3010(-)
MSSNSPSTPSSQEGNGFCKFFNALPAKPETTIRFFDRNDYITLHGEDAIFAAKTVFKTMGVVKYWGDSKLPSVNMSVMVFENTVRQLLLVDRYRVQVYSNKKGQWILSRKGSPGNVHMFEDVLYTNGATTSASVMAIKLGGSSNDKMVGAAFCDPSACILQVCEFADNQLFSNLEALIVQVGARECLIISEKGNTAYQKACEVVERCNVMVTTRKRSDFANDAIAQDLSRLLKLSEDQYAEMLPELSLTTAMDCVSAVVRYLELLNDDANFNRFALSTFNFKQYMRLDSAAVSALSLFPDAQNRSQKSQCLFGLLNKCKTAQGQRLLAQWLKQPLLDLSLICERHNIVEALATDDELRTSLVEIVRRFPDMSRIALKFRRKKAKLQDCVNMYNGVKKIPKLVAAFGEYAGEHTSLLASYFTEDLEDLNSDFNKFRELVEKTIDLAEVDSHQYLIRPDYNEDMQEARDNMDNLQMQLPDVLSKVASELSLDAQKGVKLERDTKSNSFVFRISRSHEKKIRGNKKFEIVETQKNGVKFVNKKLKAINEEYGDNYARYLDVQEAIANKVIEVTSGYSDPMDELNSVISTMDVMLSFAITSVEAPMPFTKPTMSAMGEGNILISACRHPCVEVQDDVNFIANSVRMDRDSREFQIITGPNMGGKSTYIRQIGVAVLMAQIGCFVPADSAEISICDSILARVGAGDSQLKGISTFMAEMLETASILKSATRNSLVIIDELGRGTSTYDGFGLAWAISEHLAEKTHCWCLFATHFHELTSLSDSFNNVCNMHVDAITADGSLTLLYKVKPGVCDRSFGIHVAEIAEFPKEVVEIAKEKAAELEDFNNSIEKKDGDEKADETPNPTKKAKKAEEHEMKLLDFLKRTSEVDMSDDPQHIFDQVATIKKELFPDN